MPIHLAAKTNCLFFSGFLSFSAAAQVCPVAVNNNVFAANATFNSAADYTYTYTASAGTNRLMLVAITYESQQNNQNNNFTAVTYGGQALTAGPNVQNAGTGTTPSNRSAIFYLNEAGITAATNTTVVIDFSNSNAIGGIAVSTLMLQNVNQTTPVSDPRTNSNASATALAVAANAADGGDFILALGQSSSASVDLSPTPGTYSIGNKIQLTGSHSRMLSYRILTAASASEAPGITYTGLSSRLNIVKIEINPGSVGGSCFTVLPVRISSFTGTAQAGGAVLLWQVAGESGIKEYVVERSTTGTSFVPIGTLYAQNNGSGSYQYRDASAVARRYWYRLRIVENNGSVIYSSVLLLNWELKQPLTVISPFTSNLQVYLTVPDNGDAVFQLFDHKGIRVRQVRRFLVSGTNHVSLETETLPAGSYLLQVAQGQKTWVRQVIRH